MHVFVLLEKIFGSFAVPFEEDLRNPSIWYLDHNFLEGECGSSFVLVLFCTDACYLAYLLCGAVVLVVFSGKRFVVGQYTVKVSPKQ